MPSAIRSISAPQRYRITAALDGAPSTTATDYTLTREDGGACSIDVSLAWVPTGSPNVAELALSEPLVPGVVYVLTVAGVGSAAVAFQEAAPVTQPVGDALGDPEAEVYGIDVGWISGSLDAGGRLPRRRGLACVKYDLAAIAATRRGELFHRPDDGVGVPERLNGPGTEVETLRLAGDIKRQWSRDSRVERNGVTISGSTDGEGRAVFDANVLTVAVPDPIQVRVRGA